MAERQTAHTDIRRNKTKRTGQIKSNPKNKSQAQPLHTTKAQHRFIQHRTFTKTKTKH